MSNEEFYESADGSRRISNSSNKGIYIVYFTASGGHSVGTFYIGDGIIEGVDIGGIRYSGTYKTDVGTLDLVGVVKFRVPAGSALITGFTSGGSEIEIPVELRLPADFADGKVQRIMTPTGAVNARFERAVKIP